MGADEERVSEYALRLKAEQQVLAVLNLGNEAGPHQLAHKWMYLGKVAAEQISECARREVEEFLVDYFNAKPCRSSTARNSVRTAWATRRAECSVQP